MQKTGKFSAAIQTALFAAISPIRGIIEGARLLTTVVAIPGAVAGYLLGTLVSQVIKVRRTVSVLQAAGAIVGAYLIILQAISHPLLMALYLIPVMTIVAKQTIKNLMACKAVYQELRKYGTSETLKRGAKPPIIPLPGKFLMGRNKPGLQSVTLPAQTSFTAT
ncbi:hypothetical protein [Endozoicomonas sp. 4G]|uniref:hypothetical protein n=1 Tax=Endozoicomonas sp. 4G TaxID=2872754 RepID=UPI002078D7ED|nr:hypothetical protein [Endozoicomonas sp. 4G]